MEEAGGRYTDMLGNRVEYGHAKSEQDKFAILGSNGLLHATEAPRPILLALLQDSPVISRAVAQYSPALCW